MSQDRRKLTRTFFLISISFVEVVKECEFGSLIEHVISQPSYFRLEDQGTARLHKARVKLSHATATLYYVNISK
jgi:hypothetical protein